jgi:signal transduction histidine kinase
MITTTGSAQSNNVLDSLKVRLVESESDAERANLNLEISILEKSTNPDSAIFYAKNAISFANNVGDLEIIAHCNKLLGEILQNQGNFDLSINYLHQALRLFRGQKNNNEVVEVLNTLGRVCTNAQLYQYGESFLNEADEINQQTNDRSGMVKTYFNLAYLYERSNKPEEAMGYLVMSDSINEDPSMAIQIIEGYASIYEDLGLYELARERYQEVYEMAGNDVYLITEALNNIGDTYRKLGEVEAALPYYTQSLERASEASFIRGKEQAHYDLALCYRALGELEKAFHHMDQHKRDYQKMLSIQSSQSIIQMNTLYESERKNNIIEIEKSKARIRTFQRNALFVGLSIVVFLGIYLFIILRRIRKINENLSLKTDEIAHQNNVLTEQKIRLKQTQAMLIQSEKMASIGTFTAGIAHEINNPLNYIAGGLNTIKDAIRDNKDQIPSEVIDELKEAQNYISEGFTQSSKVIRTLLTFSYPGHGTGSKLQLININEVIDNTLLFVGKMLPENVEFDKTYKAKGIFEAFPDKMHQILLNILTNAADEIKKSDRIETIRIITQDTVYHGEEVVQIQIQNTGSSIKEEYFSKLFDPFFTTKEQGEGTGLGLWITYTLVKEQNGQIEVQNIDDGVEFKLLFPSVPEMTESLTASEPG